MDPILPLFPLSLVAYPGEDLNLHIFEPRYIQLITECLENDTRFGIPAFIENKVNHIGTEMSVLKVHKKYPKGEMDIRVKGMRLFQIIEFKETLEEKLYSGATVRFLEQESDHRASMQESIQKKVLDLYTVLKIDKEFVHFTPYEIGHFIGLNLKQEYELLGLLKASQRQEFVLEHLEKMIPMVKITRKLEERAKLNGAFRKSDPLDF